MNEEEFIKEVNNLGIIVNKEKLDQLNTYFLLLEEYNKKFNLTSIISKKDVYLKHFYDSATVFMSKKITEGIKICDVGTGAGFPGLVLKILFPEIELTLIDSSNKKIEFLNELIKKLNIKDVITICDRAEEYARKINYKYDLVITRAVAKLNILCELCIPLLKVNGFFISMKANAKEEIEASKSALNMLNSKIDKILEFNLPIENSKRAIIIIKKEKETDKKYPRRYSEIKKNSL